MLAERLKLVRQAKGLSLEELAEATERAITKQAISKYERGLDYPSARVLIVLANALEVTIGTLTAEPAVEIEKLHYRRRAKMSQREQDRMESCLEFRLEESLRVRDLVSPGAAFDVPIRSRSVASVEEAEEEAYTLRKRWSLGLDPVPNVVELLEEKGVSVCMIEAEEDFDGFSAVAYGERKRPRGAAVMCRIGIPKERQRLNLVHELGHVVLAPPESMEEDCAWRFAGAFLAPRETLLADIGEFRRSISLDEMILLKKRYGVSIAALLMRLRTLEVITQDALKSAFIALNRMGIRKSEPGDTHSSEEPQWLKRAVFRAVSEGLLTASEGSELIGETITPATTRSSLVRFLAGMPLEQRTKMLELTPHPEDEEELASWDEASLGEDE